jgi:UDP-N-acetylglucosamine--N-acetylmuramyl-(pentapeptide) pyrophosphoryl-undecaprenol N-acetylglucosamine transferase
MRVLMTGGGTAGHINPALAIADKIKKEHPDAEVLFVGAKGRMETRLVPAAGYAIRTVSVRGFQRRLSLKNIGRNILAAVNVVTSSVAAAKIVKEFAPDVAIGTGGYVSGPVLREAIRHGVPTLVHESNAYPGLTTQRLSKVVDVVMVGFEESKQHYHDQSRVAVTGTPVREDFFARDRIQARRELGFSDEKRVVVTTWGSLGAQVMNDYMVDFVVRECQAGAPFHHIYGVGTRYYERVLQGIRDRGINLADYPDVDIREYIYDMPVVMAAADVVMSRAGASTVSEIAAIAKPSILVPSPNVTANHQEKNARVLSDRGGAVLMLESECSGKKLYAQVVTMLDNAASLDQMRTCLKHIGVGNANERIYSTLKALIREHQAL